MKYFSLLIIAHLCCISAFAQTIVNPFETNKNEFNQKDFIAVTHGLTGDVQQQFFGYDWIEALNQNSGSTVVPLSDGEYSSYESDGYIIIETANFNGDDKDDIFYLMENNGDWTYGVTAQDVELDGQDSLYHYPSPATPDMVSGGDLGSDYSYPCLTKGDFNGDGIPDIAVAWAKNDKIRIQLVTVSTSSGNLTVNPLAVYSDNEISKKVSNQRHALSISSGDLNGDGTDELFVSALENNTNNSDVQYNAFLKIYDVSADDNLSITPKGRMVLNETNLGELEDISNGGLSYVRTTLQSVHSYNTLDDEGAESVFAAVALTRNNFSETYDYFFSYHIDVSTDLNTLTRSEGPVIANDGGSYLAYDFPCESHRGDINGDAQDDVVVLNSSFLIFSFEDGELILENDSGYGPYFEPDASNPLSESTDRFDIGDVNRDGLDDIVSQSLFQNQDEQRLEYSIEVLSADEEFNLFEGGDLDVIIESTNPRKNYGFALGNLDGNDLCLGDPIVFDCDFFKPLIILEAIPSHFDIINGIEYDPMGCYELDNANACGNNVHFESSSTSTESSSVTATADWSVSGEVTSGFELGGFGMNSSLKYKYGERFENVNIEEDSYGISIVATANEDDHLKIIEYPFIMHEYPVLSVLGDTITWIVAAFPDVDNPTEQYKQGKSLYNYLPNHEVGNILSYPKPTDPDLYYDKSDDDDWSIYEFEPMPIDVSGDLTFTLAEEASTGLSNSSETSQTLSASVGVSGFGLGATFTGEYTESETKVFGQKLSEAEIYSISAANVIGGTNTWDYEINASLYWTRDRAAKLAMSVNFEDAGFKWDELYGQQVDPALNLPYSNEDVLNTDYIQENLDRTKSVRFDKINPNPQDTVTAFVKLFNYSLMSMNEQLPFSLYNGNPTEGGNVIADLDGNTIFQTSGLLEDQGRTTEEVSFIVTNEMIGGTDNRIYVVVDPNNEISEIHEDNNMGWTNLGYVCNTPQGVLTADEFIVANESIQFNVFPNPANQFVTIDYDASLQYLDEHLTIKIFDVSGKQLSEEVFDSNQMGSYSFDISNLISGIYIYQIATTYDIMHSGKLVVGK